MTIYGRILIFFLPWFLVFCGYLLPPLWGGKDAHESMAALPLASGPGVCRTLAMDHESSGCLYQRGPPFACRTVKPSVGLLTLL